MEITSQVTKQTPLVIKDIGLATCLAIGWEETAAAMRAGYDGFATPEHCDYPIARVDYDRSIRGHARLVHLLKLALSSMKEDYRSLPTLLALPEETREGLAGTNYQQTIYHGLAQVPEFHGRFVRGFFEVFKQGRCSLVYQLNRAREILDTTEHKQVMLMATDSYLFPQTLNALAAPEHYGSNPLIHKKRLLRTRNGEENTDGFVPAEAAGILVVEKGEVDAKQTATKSSSPSALAEGDFIIDGLGFGYESAKLIGQEPCLGEGLTAAFQQACTSAGRDFSEYPTLMSSVSGEQYFLKEASLAQTRSLPEKALILGKKPMQETYLPANHVGEIGCVCGYAMLAQAMASMKDGYGRGNLAFGHMSNDDDLRSAFSLYYRQ